MAEERLLFRSVPSSGDRDPAAATPIPESQSARQVGPVADRLAFAACAVLVSVLEVWRKLRVTSAWREKRTSIPVVTLAHLTLPRYLFKSSGPTSAPHPVSPWSYRAAVVKAANIRPSGVQQ